VQVVEVHHQSTKIAQLRLSDRNPGHSWAERAVALRWDALALFGCRRHRPLDRPGGAGLLWAINGGRLVELRRDWAVIELAENGSQRIVDRRRLEVPAANS
jgi:hypothetical protein